MPAKLTHDFVNSYYRDHGYTLDSTYNGNKNKDDLICQEGHKTKICFDKFKNRGDRCSECSGNEKWTYEEVYKAFKDKGCELLETEYINNQTKMKYKCKCGNGSSITLGNFNSGHKCSKCGGNEKLKYETVYKAFKDQGCELLETEYINTLTKMRYRCECGNESISSYNNFRSGNRCKECGLLKRTGANHPRFKKDRTRMDRTKILSFDYRKLHILNDDPNYANHVQSKNVAKTSGNRWDISDYTVDHIQPRIAFIDNDLDIKYDLKIIKEICNLRENLRIIPQKENGSKGGKYIQEEFMAWFNDKIKEYE
jgi:hypothetical protein